MKILYAVACIVALSAGAYAEGDFSPGTKTAANALRICMVRESVELDDHQSDAKTIADAVLFSCRQEYEDLMRQVSDPSVLQQILDDFRHREGIDKQALVYVLKARKLDALAAKKTSKK